MTKPFIFTGIGLFLLTAWQVISEIHWGGVAACVAGYSLVETIFG
jgi:hypothetical protein